MCYTLDNVEEIKQDEREAREQMTKRWDRISGIIYKGWEEYTKDRVATVLSAREDSEAQKSGWIDQEIGHRCYQSRKSFRERLWAIKENAASSIED